MAAGANLGEKLFGMVKTIGPVFQSYAPGLGLLDLAVGVAGAVILYFVVQSKIKKARKFRRDMEYGSARWGTEADIGENKLRELMDCGELEYIQNGNRRLLADAAIWDWYERTKRKVARQIVKQVQHFLIEKALLGRASRGIFWGGN